MVFHYTETPFGAGALEMGIGQSGEGKALEWPNFSFPGPQGLQGRWRDIWNFHPTMSLCWAASKPARRLLQGGLREPSGFFWDAWSAHLSSRKKLIPASSGRRFSRVMPDYKKLDGPEQPCGASKLVWLWRPRRSSEVSSNLNYSMG